MNMNVKYAKYPDMTKFDKKFINSKAQVYHGNSKVLNIKNLREKMSLNIF